LSRLWLCRSAKESLLPVILPGGLDLVESALFPELLGERLLFRANSLLGIFDLLFSQKLFFEITHSLVLAFGHRVLGSGIRNNFLGQRLNKAPAANSGANSSSNARALGFLHSWLLQPIGIVCPLLVGRRGKQRA